MAKQKGTKLIANNKKAYHDYFIEDTYEAGIALVGTEVKSLRLGKCSIKEAFIRVEGDEVFVYGMNISPYEKGNIFNKDPLRIRKLLLHRYEINKLIGESLSNYIQENDLNILGEPLPSETEQKELNLDEESFEFVYDIALSPAMNVKLSK